MAWVNVRIIVDTLRCGFLPDVPERIDWSAGECKGEESGDASCDTKTHDDVNGEYCFLYGENSSVLCQDRDFDQREPEAVPQDTEVKILRCLAHWAAFSA
jgi:hypothetical protein